MVDKFTIGAGCWEWTGAKTGHGYGKVLTYRRTRVAHRVLYELLIGPVPDRMELDHLCRNPGCVNPDHLEPVTHRENVMRGAHVTGVCPQGHQLTPENTYVYTYGRYCKVCHKDRVHARTAARQQKKEN